MTHVFEYYTKNREIATQGRSHCARRACRGLHLEAFT